MALLRQRAGSRVDTVMAAAELARTRRAMAESHLDRLRDGVPDDVPVLEVSEIYSRAGGRRVVSLVSDELHGALDARAGAE